MLSSVSGKDCRQKVLRLLPKPGQIAGLALGAAILSFGMYNIHTQSQITEGGVLGITLFLQYWTGIAAGRFSFVLDLLCYALGLRFLGKRFLVNAIFATTFYALFFEVWRGIGFLLPSLSGQPLIAAVLGGMFVGVGVGIIVRMGGASGGDDALALIIHKVFGWKLSRAYFFTDFVVLMLSTTYIPLIKILFSLLTVSISSFLIEKIQKTSPAKAPETSQSDA